MAVDMALLVEWMTSVQTRRTSMRRIKRANAGLRQQTIDFKTCPGPTTDGSRLRGICRHPFGAATRPKRASSPASASERRAGNGVRPMRQEFDDQLGASCALLRRADAAFRFNALEESLPHP